MADKRKKIKKPKEPWTVADAPYELLSRTLANPARDTISLDQAYDGIGVAVLLRAASAEDARVAGCEILAALDPRWHRHADPLGLAIEALWRTSEGGPIVARPLEKRRKPFSLGFIPPGHPAGRRAVMLHALIQVESNDDPEWKQARASSRNVVAAIAGLRDRVLTDELHLTLEGLALHGNKNSIAILPCVGIVWGSVWEELSAIGVTSGIELPISTWKKSFAGYGKANKGDVKNILARMGFARFVSDDESDAVAMAIVSALRESPGKPSSGRIRPVRKILGDIRDGTHERPPKGEASELSPSPLPAAEPRHRKPLGGAEVELAFRPTQKEDPL